MAFFFAFRCSDHHKSEYERKLRDELENIRLKTGQEIENLQRTSREMYERENRCGILKRHWFTPPCSESPNWSSSGRNLREARDNAVLEKERAFAAERDTQSRYDQLLEQYV